MIDHKLYEQTRDYFCNIFKIGNLIYRQLSSSCDTYVLFTVIDYQFDIKNNIHKAKLFKLKPYGKPFHYYGYISDIIELVFDINHPELKYHCEYIKSHHFI